MFYFLIILIIFVVVCLPHPMDNNPMRKKRMSPKHVQVGEPVVLKETKAMTLSELVVQCKERKYHLSNCTCIKLVWTCAKDCPARN